MQHYSLQWGKKSQQNQLPQLIQLLWYLQDATHYVANPLSGQDPPFICHSKSHQSLQLDGDGGRIGWLVDSKECKEDMAGWKSFADFIYDTIIYHQVPFYYIILYHTSLARSFFFVDYSARAWSRILEALVANPTRRCGTILDGFVMMWWGMMPDTLSKCL